MASTLETSRMNPVDASIPSSSTAVPACSSVGHCVANCRSCGRVCPLNSHNASQFTKRRIRELSKNSKVFQQSIEDDLPRLALADLKVAEKLGEGGYACVRKCLVKRGSKIGQEFAFKHLKKQAMLELSSYKHGAADMVVEAFFLQALDYPNIVKLHGFVDGPIDENVALGEERSMFLVVDLLTETLNHRIKRWRLKEKSLSGHSLLRRVQKQKRKLMIEKCQVALQIIEAIDYLHKKGIVFRDLKPDNIGFDKYGVVKIFDFGLAKELKDNRRMECGKYKLMGGTGSQRFMAPEVARAQPYDVSVDVYSFGILLWEMLTTDRAFDGVTTFTYWDEVVQRGGRPPLDDAHTHDWPDSMALLLQDCWSTSPESRPSLNEVKSVLQAVIDDKDADSSDEEIYVHASDSSKTTDICSSSRRSTEIVTLSEQRTVPKHGRGRRTWFRILKSTV